MIKRLYKIFFIFICILLLKSHSHAFDIKARTAILQDFSSGEILFEKEPDREIYPASMTKIMTSIIAFELLENGELSLDDTFTVSKKAWKLSEMSRNGWPWFRLGYSGREN